MKLLSRSTVLSCSLQTRCTFSKPLSCNKKGFFCYKTELITFRPDRPSGKQTAVGVKLTVDSLIFSLYTPVDFQLETLLSLSLEIRILVEKSNHFENCRCHKSNSYLIFKIFVHPVVGTGEMQLFSLFCMLV